jgi:hypothetical protein
MDLSIIVGKWHVSGDRLIISKTLKNPIPRKLQIGKYWALVFHSGQPEFSTHNQQITIQIEQTKYLCHAKLNPAPTMTVCLPHYPYKYATYP